MNVIVDGERIREARLEQLMEREELVEKSGVSWSTVTRLELGKEIARASTVRKIADALGLDYGTLAREEVVTHPTQR